MYALSLGDAGGEGAAAAVAEAAEAAVEKEETAAEAEAPAAAPAAAAVAALAAADAVSPAPDPPAPPSPRGLQLTLVEEGVAPRRLGVGAGETAAALKARLEIPPAARLRTAAGEALSGAVV